MDPLILTTPAWIIGIYIVFNILLIALTAWMFTKPKKYKAWMLVMVTLISIAGSLFGATEKIVIDDKAIHWKAGLWGIGPHREIQLSKIERIGFKTQSNSDGDRNHWVEFKFKNGKYEEIGGDLFFYYYDDLISHLRALNVEVEPLPPEKE